MSKTENTDQAKVSAITKQDHPQTISTKENHGVVAVYRSAGQIWWANMLGGMAWGVGSVIGATLIVAGIIVLVDTLGGIPVIGDFVHKLAEEVNKSMNSTTQ